jgi:hypothetical protein
MCFFDVTRHQIRYTGKEGMVAGTVLKPKIQVDEIVVNSKKKYQEIIGFGGITSVVAYNELSDKGKTDWWEFLKKYNLLIQREYPNGTKLKEDCSNFDVLEDASVHYYGDNFPNGEISDFKYNKQIMDLGGLVIFEFWALPPWAGKDIKDESGRIRQRPIIKKYTKAVVNYCKISEQKTGKPPQIVGIQNERNQPPGVWQNMTLSLRKALDDNEFTDVKIHMFNSGKLSGGIKAAKAFTHKKEVWQAIDYTATNMYDYQGFFLDPDGYDERIREWKEIVQNKPFISTELCINNSKFQHDSYHLALTMGQLYHKNLALMDAKVIMYCWMLLNGPQPSFDGTRSLFKVSLEDDSRPIPSSKQLRVFGAFSKHLVKGMRRLKVENSNKDLLVTAYQNGQSKILIILNRSSYPQQVNINWEAATFNNAEIVDTFKENISVNINELFDSNNFLEILGGQIITLIE